jgi:hypothetical protein
MRLGHICTRDGAAIGGNGTGLIRVLLHPIAQRMAASCAQDIRELSRFGTGLIPARVVWNVRRRLLSGRSGLRNR